jgi:hypothetical protein
MRTWRVRENMSGEENPYIEHSEEIEDYCEKCCSDCPPSEMCPGCDCSDYCAEEEEEYDWDVEEEDWEEVDWEEVDWCEVDPELDPLCYTEDEEEL